MTVKCRCFIHASIALILVPLTLHGCVARSAGDSVASQTTTPVVASSDIDSAIQQTGLDVTSAFETWMQKHKVPAGAIAISHQGTSVLEHGFKRNVNTAYPVASLSKVITAVCLQQLLNKQEKSLNLTLKETIPELLGEFPPTDPAFSQITLAQLVGHNSGIHSRYHGQFISNNRAFKQPAMRRQFKALAAEKPAAAPESGYHYSNANYLLLGLAIEELSGQPYEQHCIDALLQPAGITAQLNPDWRVMSSWGGWAISAPDFLTFLNRYFANNKVLGKSPASIEVNTPVGRGAYYNLGTFTRAANQGHRFWHAGSWRWQDNLRNDRFGAYFVTREDGLMVTVNYAADAQGEKLQDLENELVRAMGLK